MNVLFLLLVLLCHCSGGMSKKFETFAFVLPDHENVWLNFDWTKLTTIALVGFVHPDLIRYAHNHGVKVVSVENIAKKHLLSRQYRRQWIKQVVKKGLENNLDGFNLDFEEPLANHSLVQAALTDLVRELSEATKASIANAQISIDVAWSPACIDQRCYDYKSIAKVVDFLFGKKYIYK